MGVRVQGGRVVVVGSFMLRGLPAPPKYPLIELLWSLIVGIQGIIEGSWGVLVGFGAVGLLLLSYSSPYYS